MEWNDIADVWLYWDDVKSRIIRNVSEKIGFSSGKVFIIERSRVCAVQRAHPLPPICPRFVYQTLQKSCGVSLLVLYSAVRGFCLVVWFPSLISTDRGGGGGGRTNV